MALGVMALALGAGLHAATAQGSRTVAIVDFAFEPALSGVAVGETLTWTNTGAEPHTVTADDSSFTSGRLDPGASFRQTFAATGSFTYRCRIHPSMTGTVVVAGSGKGDAMGAGMQQVPVVGVGTMAPRQSAGLALLAGVAAAILGAAALAMRRA